MYSNKKELIHSGSNNFDEASEYVRTKFLSCKPIGKEVYTHMTNATNTENINKVFEATMDIVITKNMKDGGIE
jgi:hypothetical protein